MEESGNSVCREGTVRKITGDDIIVEITVKSACANCHAKAMCSLSESKQEFIHAKSLYPSKPDVGDKVEVVMRQSMGGKAVLIGYFFPFLVLIIALFAGYWLTKHEAVSVLIALGATAIYYIIIWKLHKKLSKQFIFYVRPIE